MSALVEKLVRLHGLGHSGVPPELFGDQRLEGITEFRPAAVLAAFTDRAKGPGILLLHRPSNMRSHPGQIALPGGGIDPGEAPVEAALREAWEELGIRPRDVRVIGTSDVYRTHSGFEITPVVGVVPAAVASSSSWSRGLPLELAGRTVYRLRALEHSADRLVLETENVSPIRVAIVTLFEPGALQVATFLERLDADTWGLYEITRASADSSAMVAGYMSSWLNRLEAIRRLLAGQPTDGAPPIARW